MKCVRISEPEDATKWQNTFLCHANVPDYHLKWVNNGLVNKSKTNCIKFTEPEDTNGWNNNYLCGMGS